MISKPLPGFVPERARFSGSVRLYGESSSTGGGANVTVAGSGRNWAAYVAANASRHNDLRGGGSATNFMIGTTDLLRNTDQNRVAEVIIQKIRRPP